MGLIDQRPSVKPKDLDVQFVRLEAVDADHNIARRYSIAVDYDLFGNSVVTFSWGRIGTRGQARTVSFAVADEANRFVRTLLRRRANAPQRIGIAYREVQQCNPGSLPPVT